MLRVKAGLVGSKSTNRTSPVVETRMLLNREASRKQIPISSSGPRAAAGRAGATRRRVVAAQSVGAKEHLPLLARRLGRPQRQRQQRLAVIAPAANRLQPRFPTMIERRANEQPPQARQPGLQSARQRVAMPVIPGIISERRASAHRVEVGIEFGFRRRSRVFNQFLRNAGHKSLFVGDDVQRSA